MYFPVFVDLSEKEILIVGGGKVATRRIGILLDFANRITVVSPTVTKELSQLADEGRVCHLRRCFVPEDLDGKAIVLAATDDEALNRQIAALCRDARIPVNVSSDQSLCDFFFPSVVKNGDVVIGINASGKDHSLVKQTRESIEAFLQQPSA